MKALVRELTPLLRSLGFILSNHFVRRDYDILFYYPAHFNRDEKGKNPYFHPLYEACEKAGLRYLVLEEPELFGPNRRDPTAVPADLLAFASILLRKTLPLSLFATPRHREWAIGRILKAAMLRRLQFRIFISLSQSFVEHVRGMDETVEIFDLQHGILHTTHEMAFDRKEAIAAHIRENRIRLLLYGRGFHRLLAQNDPSGYYERCAFVIGNPLKKRASFPPVSTARKTVLVSLQFMDFADDCPHCNAVMKELLASFLQHFSPVARRHGLRIVLKHHPRYDGKSELDDILVPEARIERNAPLTSLLADSFVHLTFNSSTLLEASDAGIPTLLLQNDTHVLSPAFYVRELGYPLTPFSAPEAVRRIESYLRTPDLFRHDSESVWRWQNAFFEPFDATAFVHLMRNTLQKRSPCDLSD